MVSAAMKLKDACSLEEKQRNYFVYKVHIVKAIVFLVVMYRCESESHSVVPDSLRSHGLDSLWNSPSQNTGVDSHSFLQGIFPTQGSKMWELDNEKKGWGPKNWCFWTVMLEKTLQSPLNSNEIKPVNPKGNQSWIFIGTTDVEAEA